ncbi:MAG: LPS export ABC transporter periplasmic protein LptC [Candidatus Thioglobus sp.]|nr:LPS export ABC transporter periplasmic protein LptC [Candidatus Thioglobus sp.]
MAVFQTKKIQSFIAFIIVLVAILWLFQDNILKISILQNKTEQLDSSNQEFKEDSYLEKIDNFIIKEYSKDQILLHTVEAETYFSYKDSPVQLLKVKVKTFDETQQEGLEMTSNRAEILKSGEMFFNGEVNIRTKSGVAHEIDTESLIVLTNNGQIKSNREITYLAENAKINAQGMDMSIDSDTMLLNGKVKINQDSGSIINTTNLFISHAEGEKKYQSKEKTVYISKYNTVNSEKGIDADMNKNLIKLLGEIEIVGLSGSKMESYDLLIDQSNGGEVYKSNDSVHYQSSAANIKAKKMNYDAVTKKLELMDEVLAVYE